MVNKRKLNHDYHQLRKIRSRYLLAAALLFLGLGIYGLRQNYSQMAKLRQAVAVADEQNKDVEKALRDLREFVYAHMNTNLSSGNVSIKPPIQLKYRYERLAKKEAERAKQINQQVKREGERVCAAKYPTGVFNSARVTCVADYVRVHSVKENSIPSELYKFDFMSPSWSPDLAGISLLVSLLFFAALAAKALVGLYYRYRLE